MSALALTVICFIVAAVLAVVDLLVPSGGVLAVASLMAGLLSVYFGFQSDYTTGVLTLTLILVAIPIFIAVALRLWPHTPIGKRVILKIPEQPDQPTEGSQSPLHELIGQVGIAQSPLMPYGFIRLAGRNHNAMSEGGVIEAGQNVVVLNVQQRNLIVAITSQSPVTAPARNAPEPSMAPENLLDRPAEELGLDSLD